MGEIGRGTFLENQKICFNTQCQRQWTAFWIRLQNCALWHNYTEIVKIFKEVLWWWTPDIIFKNPPGRAKQAYKHFKITSFYSFQRPALWNSKLVRIKKSSFAKLTTFKEVISTKQVIARKARRLIGNAWKPLYSAKVFFQKQIMSGLYLDNHPI